MCVGVGVGVRVCVCVCVCVSTSSSFPFLLFSYCPFLLFHFFLFSSLPFSFSSSISISTSSLLFLSSSLLFLSSSFSSLPPPLILSLYKLSHYVCVCVCVYVCRCVCSYLISLFQAWMVALKDPDNVGEDVMRILNTSTHTKSSHTPREADRVLELLKETPCFTPIHMTAFSHLYLHLPHQVNILCERGRQ